MKKVMLLIVFLIPALFAQDEPLSDYPFGGGGGFIAAWTIPAVDALNAQLKSFGTDNISTGGFFSSGGAGFFYPAIIPNLRIGGIGFSGVATAEGMNNGDFVEARYHYSLGGLTVEYTLPFTRAVAISIGGIFGAGEKKIELFRNKGGFDWGSIWNEASSVSGNASSQHRTLTSVFFAVTPTLNIDIPLHRFIALRLGAGYSLAFGDDTWKGDNDKTVANVPKDLHGRAFFAHAGIFFGFFSF